MRVWIFRGTRLLVCSATLFLCYSVIINGGHTYNSMYTIIEEPLSFTSEYVIFLISCIVFWHTALFALIFPGRTTKWRAPLLRSFDYVWYGGAVMSAIFVANGLWSDTLLKEQQYYHDKMSTYEKMVDGKTIRASCTFLLTAYEEQASHRYGITVQDIKRLCSRVPFTGATFIEDCAQAGLVDLAPEGYGKAVKDGSELDINISKLQDNCTAAYIYNSNERTAEKIDRIVSSPIRLPSQRSYIWVYIISAIIGLRLTRTSAELFDSLSSS